MVYLENEFVKLGILPELGGRLFSAVDKTNNYDFIYRQHVIKPALIGLTGAWISGGIEWNIPHHHRASTFVPVQYSVEEGPDGSKTVWVGELELRHRMRWAVGYTLRPGSAVVDCNIRILNRTPLEQTMLCFANIAVSVNDDYQVIFPPNTQWATGHSKRTFYPWPVADTTDVSWYRNNLRSASWFAVNEKDDFVAGYDHGKNAGIMSFANRHTVAGKKFFTWGVGNIWDKILTDDDGPYLEIMVGAYSDNQPDYSWLQPGEERSFTMSFFPFRGIEGVKNATTEAAVNLEVLDNRIICGFYTTESWPEATITLRAGDRVLLTEKAAINPGKPWYREMPLPAGVKEGDIRASLTAGGCELIAFTPFVPEPEPKPVPYTEPLPPADYDNNEELFLAGQRLYQFHHPSLDADPYWEELLKRDPGNVAANTGMGIIYLKKAQYNVAEGYFRKAAERLTAQHTVAKNVEPLYYLGIALQEQGRSGEAYAALYKAAWKQEWKSPAYLALAEIASKEGNLSAALSHVESSLDANAFNVRAYVLKSALLRHAGRTAEALEISAFARHKCDPLDLQLLAESWLAKPDAVTAETLFSSLEEHPANAMEIAAGYLRSGFYDDGMVVLDQMTVHAQNINALSPMVFYYLGHFAELRGDVPRAAEYRQKAALQPSDYVFPFEAEAISVLQSAIAANASDARAPYYLGNLLYDWQPEEAVTLWEKASLLDPGQAVTWRNLAIAYSHREGDDQKYKAIACLEKAIALPNPYPTHFAELDQLYKSVGASVEKRLALLEKFEKVVSRKDEALGSMINLKIFAGKSNEAIALMENRIFSIWEGGSAFNTGQAWANAHLTRGMKYFASRKYKQALADFQSALTAPENLRAEGRNPRMAQLHYWIGNAYDALGDKAKAREAWTAATLTDVQPLSRRWFDNSQGQKYFITLAQKNLDPSFETRAFFQELADNQSKTAVGASNELDFQFVRARLNTPEYRAYPHYVAGLGYLGLGDKVKAREKFNAALKECPDYLDAKIALSQF
jgi:tetratricopeptide (TPR) repeat protein